MAEKLTPQQETAVNNSGGELLVSAAAGSGKTKVLVDRLLRYITDPVHPCNIDDFLIITYTKAAASELRAKIAAKISQRIAEQPENRHLQQQMQRLYLAKISTVHSFCSDILRENAYMLNIPLDFRVAEENECLELQARVMQNLLDEAYTGIGSDPQFQQLVDTQGLGRDDRTIPEIIYKVYNSARCHLNPEKWLEWCASICNASGLEDASQTVWGAYLIQDLHKYLQLQIETLRKCITLAEADDELNKPAELLRDTVIQLEHLASCKTWSDICHCKDIDYGKLTFPRNCFDPALVAQIKAVRDACKTELNKKLRNFADNNRQVLTDIDGTKDACLGLLDLVKQFSDSYSNLKRRYRILDFSDLEHMTLDLLTGKNRAGATRLAQEIGARFTEIMVDEYQDSNVVQDTIFQALTMQRHNCFMVGDVKQSIYQFRLADPGIFLEKYNQYAPAVDAQAGEGRKVLLSSNFRSAASVIHAVNDVFSMCMSTDVGGLDYGEDEALHEGIPHSAATEPEIELYGIQVAENRYEEEAAFVAQRISELLDGTHTIREGDAFRPITAGDIVILLRSPGSVGQYFESALARKGIRYCNGSSDDLLHTEEIVVLRALLQVICNPLQDIPLVACLTSRIFCFSADELADFRSKHNYGSIYSALKEWESEKAISFLTTLNQLRKASRMGSVTDLLGKIFTATRFDSIYASMSDGRERVENLQAFCQIAAGFESNGSGDLLHFLAHLDALEQRGVAATPQATDTDAVTIMSIHKSKGLEFPVVFLCSLSRKFSGKSIMGQVLCDKDLGLGLSCVDVAHRLRYPSVAKRAIASSITSQGISEEMRVLYVAMTRAKDRLIMTYAAQNLDKTLTALVNRMDISHPLLMTGDVNCPGTWILLAALRRAEANAFFALSGKPSKLDAYKDQWLIRVVTAPDREENSVCSSLASSEKIPADAAARIRAGLDYVYPYPEATQAPSKQTATQLKGRDKDREARANAAERFTGSLIWRKPAFVPQQVQATTYGNALHGVMQYIRYAACDSVFGVQQELERLVAKKYVSPQEAALVDPGSIAAFFSTEIGQLLRKHPNVQREFKFSVLDDGQKYYPNMAGERILLQGVVDCALIDDDGIIILDFKTDRVKEETLPDAVERYSSQIRAYADALSRIYALPVKSAQLYFFALNRFVEIP